MDSLWRIMNAAKLFLIMILSSVLFVIGNLLFLVLVFEEHPVLKAIGMTVIFSEMCVIVVCIPCFLYQLLIKRRSLSDSWKATVDAAIEAISNVIIGLP